MLLDISTSDDLQNEAIARQVTSHIQKIRKSLSLVPINKIKVLYNCADKSLLKTVIEKAGEISKTINGSFDLDDTIKLSSNDCQTEKSLFRFEVGDQKSFVCRITQV